MVAAIFGGAIIRMTEATMAMATLALLVVVHTFFQNATTYTRGALGLAGIPVRTTLGIATVAAIGFVLLSRLYKDSGPGLRLRAHRERTRCRRPRWARTWCAPATACGC